MKRLLSLCALAAVLGAGCNSSPPSTMDYAAGAGGGPPSGVATVREGGIVELKPANSKVEFAGKDGKRGSFSKFAGEIRLRTMAPGSNPPPEDRTRVGSIQVQVEGDSIQADDAKLAEDAKAMLKGQAEISFTSTKIVPQKLNENPDEMTITGDLSIRGKKKSVTFPASSRIENGMFFITARFKINKNDFGLDDEEVAVTVTVGQDSRPNK